MLRHRRQYEPNYIFNLHTVLRLPSIFEHFSYEIDGVKRIRVDWISEFVSIGHVKIPLAHMAGHAHEMRVALAFECFSKLESFGNLEVIFFFNQAPILVVNI